MKVVALILLGLLAVCSAQEVVKDVPYESEDMADDAEQKPFNLEDYEIDITDVDFENFEEEIFDPSSRLFVISWKVRHEIRKLQKQMPCGFPKYGIPPLAPLRKEDLVLSVHKAFVDSLDDLHYFTVYGLNDFKMQKLTINMITKKVKYNLIFKKIHLISNYITNTFANLMAKFGIDIRFEGNGKLDLAFKNLNLSGSFKYKLPVLFGSIKIYNFYCLVSLGSCESDISGILGSGKTNRLMNQFIEDIVMHEIADNHKIISDTIEENVVPRVNKALKGYNAWDLIAMITGGGNDGPEPPEPASKCIAPPPLPWE